MCIRDRNWTKIKPGAEESHTKTVHSDEYIWCDRCGCWRKGDNKHVTANHKTRAELAAEAAATPPSGGTLPVPAPAPAGGGNVGGLRMMGGLFHGGIVPGNREYCEEIVPGNREDCEESVVSLNWEAGRQ